MIRLWIFGKPIGNVQMPWLPMYLVAEDVPSLWDMLNSDPEVALLASNGFGRWIARQNASEPGAGRMALWHIPSGPLPLLGETTSDRIEQVSDPWSGWAERRRGVDSSLPYFGAGHPGVIWLNLRLPARERGSFCGLSSFEWIGNRYSRIGNAAKPETEQWWKKLRREVRKLSRLVPRVSLDSSFPAEVFAFPVAYSLLESGRTADANP